MERDICGGNQVTFNSSKVLLELGKINCVKKRKNGSFNSSKVLLELAHNPYRDCMFEILSILLKSYWNSISPLSRAFRRFPPFNSSKVLLELDLFDHPLRDLTNLSILLKSYWNETFKAVSARLGALSFNSSKVLLEHRAEGFDSDTRLSFNSSKVLLELVRCQKRRSNALHFQFF